jgi:hypothetical protein
MGWNSTIQVSWKFVFLTDYKCGLLLQSCHVTHWLF